MYVNKKYLFEESQISSLQLAYHGRGNNGILEHYNGKDRMLSQGGPVQRVKRIACRLGMSSDSLSRHQVFSRRWQRGNGAILDLLVQRLLRSLAPTNGNCLFF